MQNYPVINTEATGKRIKELCRHCNISVNDVREFMGFENPQAIYKWLRGESLPTLDNFYALSRLLNVPLDSLIISVEDLGGFSTDSFFVELFLMYILCVCRTYVKRWSHIRVISIVSPGR